MNVRAKERSAMFGNTFSCERGATRYLIAEVNGTNRIND